MNKKFYGNLMLLLTSFIWGSAFVAQVTGMDLIGPFAFNTSRSVLAVISLGLLTFFIKDRVKGKVSDLIKGGLACGFFLFMGTSLQQVGIAYTTAGKTSFITTLYILIIPIFGFIFLKHKVNLITWFAVLLGLIGLYLIAIPSTSSFSMNKGDFIVFIGSFFWSGHILVIDYFNKKVDVLRLSLLQFAMVAVLSGIITFIFERETTTMVNIFLSWKSIAYAGVLSAAVAYTLQMVGQKYTTPVLASLILSLESVFGALSGYLFLNEILSTKEFIGCTILFIAIIIVQIPTDIFQKKNKKLKN